MDEQEVRNFLRGEGEELTEVAVPAIDINERGLQDIADEIESEGLEHLVHNLGTIANTFKTENDYSCPPEVIEEGVKLLHTALLRLYNGITSLQGNVRGSLANIDRPNKLKFRKYMAVLFFLINKSFVEIERAVATDYQNLSIMAQQQMAGQKGKRGKRQPVAEPDDSKYQFWQFWRPKIVSELLRLVVPPMDEIWEGNLDGYNFFRCITLALCTAIKNKSRRIRTMDPELEEIFDVLGILACKHQEEKGITTRLIPLLKESEDTATIIADGISRMINQAPENQRPNMVLGTLTEALDTYMSRLDKDSTAEKGFNNFLTSFSQYHPKGFMHSLAVVVQFLEADSPSVRNAVVAVAIELMNWTWEEITADMTAQDNVEDGRDERPHVRNWLNMRQKVLDEILLLHCQDVAAVVRSKAIQALQKIVMEKSLLPIEAVKIMQCVRKRLLDKNNFPRKYATELVIALVKTYPLMTLKPEEYERKRQEKWDWIVKTILDDHPEEPGKAIYFIIKEFHEHRKADGFTISNKIKELVTEEEKVMEVMEDFLKNKHYWQACETMYLYTRKWADRWEQLMIALRRHDDDQEEHIYLRFFKSTCPDIFPEAVDDLELEEVNYIASKEMEAARIFLEHIQCCLLMSWELEKCIPSLRRLLELGNTIDKKEAVTFFSEICEKSYVLKRPVIVSLINAFAQLNDEELKDFMDQFKNIFIGRENFGSHGVVKKLLELVQQLPDNLVECLDSTIKQLYCTGSLNNESIKILWDAFSLSTGGWDASASCSAAHLLGIIGHIERKVITSNLTQLIEVGLGERGVENYELAKVTLQAILVGCRLEQDEEESDNATGKGKAKASKANKKKQNGEDIKFPPTHDLFEKIVHLIEYGLKEEGREKMDMMYPRVVELSMQIVYRMCSEPFEVVRKILPNIHGLVFEEPIDDNAEVGTFKASERILFRYMSFGKALLGAHVMFYEQIVSKEIKGRKSSKELANKKNKLQNRQRSRLSHSTVSTTTTNSSMNQTNQETAAEMDLVMGHIGFDAEQDMIKGYVGKLLDQGFFRQFRVHVFFLCQFPAFDSIQSVNLKVAAVQALSKLMLVCENSVTSSLDVFIKLWLNNQPFAVKLEILRASIRLTVKFPNQMEKMNNALTTGLSDKDVNVRKACMDYICYLALSDLLKVKEQFHRVAACLCDESFELREMAKDFINQISEKDNILQNCIPDIMSRLSARDDIPQVDFQSIMKTLLQKVKREKQLGGLVDRIVQRFKGQIPIRSVQDTIFCLNQIQQNDKTLKVMKDNIANYCDKLGDPIVWDSFMDLLATFKKLNKPELKLKIEEWEKELEEYHEKCVSLDNADKAAKRKNEKQKIVAESSSEDEGEEEKNEENDGNADAEDDDKTVHESEGEANDNGENNEEDDTEGSNNNDDDDDEGDSQRMDEDETEEEGMDDD